MNVSLNQSAVTRLLVLNDQIRDLDRQLEDIYVYCEDEQEEWMLPSFKPSPVADLQDEIDRVTRASLVTCWLAAEDDPQD